MSMNSTERLRLSIRRGCPDLRAYRNLVGRAGINPWCPRPESNRHDREVEGFSCHFGFRRQRERCSWSGARLHHSPAHDAHCHRCPPSALYTFLRPCGRRLGSVSARTLARPGPSPSLTGFTSGVSPGGLKPFKSLVSTNFTTRACRRPSRTTHAPGGRRACSSSLLLHPGQRRTRGAELPADRRAQSISLSTGQTLSSIRGCAFAVG